MVFDQDYDTDKLFPALGFGARVPPQGKVLYQNCYHHHHNYHQCDPTQKARKGTTGQGHKSFPGEPQLQLKPLIKQPLLQGVFKKYLYRDSISSILNFVFPVKSSISPSPSAEYLHECMIVLRKFCPNFAHSVRKKITVSSNIIPQGIDGVISAYYKVVVNNSYQ